jgi:16S rRNA (guanine(966)-N(2))-methyltransferase RsmD
VRIIAGQARGRRILSVSKDAPVRPILARIRQSLFDILRPRVPGCCFLDMFAGTGAVGLEALSRGAQKAVFLESHRTSLKVIEKNVANLGFADRAVILQGDATHALSWLPYRSGGRPFDLVFMGPPYVDKEKRPMRLVGGVLKNLVEGKVLSDTAWIVAQHHKKEPFEVPSGLEQFRQMKYGDSMLTFFRVPGGRPRVTDAVPNVEPFQPG